MRLVLLAIVCMMASSCGKTMHEGNVQVVQNQNPQIELRVTNKVITTNYEHWHAENGKIFVVVHILLHNGGNTSIAVVTNQFNLLGSSGRIYGTLPSVADGTVMKETRIASQRMVTETLLFEIPSDEQIQKLIFAPSAEKTIELSI